MAHSDDRWAVVEAAVDWDYARERLNNDPEKTLKNKQAFAAAEEKLIEAVGRYRSWMGK